VTDYQKYTTKTINPVAISTKISSLVATEIYCKWNRNISSTHLFFLVWLRVACVSKRLVWHHKTT